MATPDAPPPLSTIAEGDDPNERARWASCDFQCFVFRNEAMNFLRAPADAFFRQWLCARVEERFRPPPESPHRAALIFAAGLESLRRKPITAAPVDDFPGRHGDLAAAASRRAPSVEDRGFFFRINRIGIRVRRSALSLRSCQRISTAKSRAGWSVLDLNMGIVVCCASHREPYFTVPRRLPQLCTMNLYLSKYPHRRDSFTASSNDERRHRYSVSGWLPVAFVDWRQSHRILITATVAAEHTLDRLAAVEENRVDTDVPDRCRRGGRRSRRNRIEPTRSAGLSVDRCG